jgi:hypothetical protein
MENPQQEGRGIVFKKPHEAWTEESEITRQPELLPLTQALGWFVHLGPTKVQIVRKVASHTIDTGNSVG